MSIIRGFRMRVSAIEASRITHMHRSFTPTSRMLSEVVICARRRLSHSTIYSSSPFHLMRAVKDIWHC